MPADGDGPGGHHAAALGTFPRLQERWIPGEQMRAKTANAHLMARGNRVAGTSSIACPPNQEAKDGVTIVMLMPPLGGAYSREGGRFCPARFRNTSSQSSISAARIVFIRRYSSGVVPQ